MTTITIRGVLTWHAKERRSDRYGGIGLLERAPASIDDDDVPCVSLAKLRPLIGRTVKVTAWVREARESFHIGDIARGISAKGRAKVGEPIDLGQGELIDVEIADDMEQFLFCRDGREKKNDWIDPRLLYRLHNQTVDVEVAVVQ